MSEAEKKRVEPGDDAWCAAMHTFRTWHSETVEDLVSETKAERLSHAKSLLDADNILEVLENGCDALLDDVTEHTDKWLHETVDGCAPVIYTNQAEVILLVSDNADAYAEEIGEAPPNVHAQAYMALRADIREGME